MFLKMMADLKGDFMHVSVLPGELLSTPLMIQSESYLFETLSCLELHWKKDHNFL